MHRLQRSLACLALALLIHLPAQAAASLERLQLAACRTTSSFLLLRGEGQQSGHRHALTEQRAGLQSAFDELPAPLRERLLPPYQHLLERLDTGLTYGPREDDLPWQYPEQLSRALVTLLEQAEAMPKSPRPSALHSAVKLEYFAALYAGQAYLGYFDVTPTPDARYPNQSGEQLLASLDQEMRQHLPRLAQGGPEQARRAQAEWRYLRAALADFDSAGRARLGHSGKPLVPLMVSRYSRNLSERLLTLAD